MESETFVCWLTKGPMENMNYERRPLKHIIG
jgi:hypothetical protein